MSVEVENYRLELLKNLEKNPEDINALISLGILEFEYFHEPERARILLEKATAVDPLNVNAKFWLAQCLFNDFFEYEKAKKMLQEALELDPNNPKCLSLMAWIMRENNGPLKEAIEYVQKALAYAPDWPLLRYQLAGLFLDAGEPDAAAQEVKKAFQIYPLDPKKVTNEIERYYENVITGRIWKDMNKEFYYIIQRIQKAKKTEN